MSGGLGAVKAEHIAQADTPVGRSVVETIGCVGLGVIGTAWTALYLAHGYRVNVTDADPAIWPRALAEIESNLNELRQLGLEPGDWKGKLRYFDFLEAAIKGADFVQENGPEDIELKRTLFSEIDAQLDPDVIIASSTSGIPVSILQSECAHPGRCVVAHPFTPAHLIPLVEVVGGGSTRPSAVEWVKRFYEGLGKEVVVVRKDVPGFLVNRLQTLLLQEALSLVKTGVATVADIDKAFVSGPGLRLALYGPFALAAFSAGTDGIGEALRRYKGHREAVFDSIEKVEVDEHLVNEIEAQLGSADIDYTTAQALSQRNNGLIRLINLLRPHLPAAES